MLKCKSPQMGAFVAEAKFFTFFSSSGEEQERCLDRLR